MLSLVLDLTAALSEVADVVEAFTDVSLGIVIVAILLMSKMAVPREEVEAHHRI